MKISSFWCVKKKLKKKYDRVCRTDNAEAETEENNRVSVMYAEITNKIEYRQKG